MRLTILTSLIVFSISSFTSIAKAETANCDENAFSIDNVGLTSIAPDLDFTFSRQNGPAEESNPVPGIPVLLSVTSALDDNVGISCIGFVTDNGEFVVGTIDADVLQVPDTNPDEESWTGEWWGKGGNETVTVDQSDETEAISMSITLVDDTRGTREISFDPAEPNIKQEVTFTRPGEAGTACYEAKLIYPYLMVESHPDCDNAASQGFGGVFIRRPHSN